MTAKVKKQRLIVAVQEAKRFIKAADKIKDDDDWYGSKETATAKRASMDLTRALAEFRRSSWNG